MPEIPSEQLFRKIVRLVDWCEAREFAGSDPYDAMNSPLLAFLSLNTLPGKILWTQLLRRSPWDLRPLLLVPPGRNPKGLGLFLESFVRMAQLLPEEKRWRDGIDFFVAELQGSASKQYRGYSWGYHFPWQSRVAFVAKGTPTIVNTAFIGHALLDAYDKLGIEQALEMATGTAEFMLNDLNRKKEGDAFCFSYTPTDENYVHNANMLGASLLIRLAKSTGRSEWVDPAMGSMSYSMNHQRDDGSWFYAETQTQSFIDSFHTGFNLESLRRFLGLGAAPATWLAGFEKGKRYYRERFFLEDFTPKYYHNRLYCVDAHAPAEAIYFFSGEGPEGMEFAGKVLQWFLDNMYDERQGVFYYRKYQYLTSKIPYMRWVEAWAMRGLTEHLRVKELGK